MLIVPVHHTNGFDEVYRTVPVPQPIEDSSTATRYSFSRSYLLISERKDKFAEATEEKLMSHWSGSNCLELCLKLFSRSRRGESTCLSSLFFDLQTSVLMLCAQQVVAGWTTQLTWLTCDPVTIDYSTSTHKPSILASGSTTKKLPKLTTFQRTYRGHQW